MNPLYYLYKYKFDIQDIWYEQEKITKNNIYIFSFGMCDLNHAILYIH
jgi:hypothetical protein